MYKTTNKAQEKAENFDLPFGGRLASENRCLNPLSVQSLQESSVFCIRQITNFIWMGHLGQTISVGLRATKIHSPDVISWGIVQASG